MRLSRNLLEFRRVETLEKVPRKRGTAMKLSRSVVIFLGLSSLIFTAPLRADEKGYSYARIVRLSMVRGDVQITRSGASDWEAGIPNMPIQQGFAIGTNNGRAEIEFESGAAMWVAENTVVQFTEMALSDGGRITRLTIAQGTASFQVKLSAGDVFEVNAPSFQVTVPNHSKFREDTFRDGASLSVYEGTASLKDGDSTEIVGTGKTFAMRGSAPGDAKLTPNPGKDSWDSWVNDRAGIILNGADQTQPYTNAPFSYGLNDLSSYGSWSDCAGYGYGWQPWGASAGWAPFYDGYFDYYNGLGWTWVSFEPWGWAPYHFGSWSYASSCGGWMWMPGSFGFWTGAPVIFGRTGGGRIGWRPRPVPNPRRSEHPLATASNGSVHGKFGDVPIVVGAKGGIGNGFATGILPPGKADEIVAVMDEPPGKNGRIGANEFGWRSTSKQPFAVPTARSLAALRDGVAFDAKENRFVNAEAAAGASEKLPVLANGIREPHGVPHQPEPSSFSFERESRAGTFAPGRSGISDVTSHSGEFSHGSESSHGSFDSGGSHSGGSSSSSSAPAAHSH